MAGMPLPPGDQSRSSAVHGGTRPELGIASVGSQSINRWTIDTAVLSSTGSPRAG